MKRFLVVGFIVLVVGKAFAQAPNCSQTLRLATSTYEQGRLHELPGLLDGCLKSGFTTEQKVQAYKLLTLAYIYLEEPEKADEAMLKILQTNNYFQVNDALDPAEFIALYKTFRTKEIFRLGLTLGPNLTQTNLISSNSASAASSKYQFGYGFSGGVAAEIPFTRKITFNPEIQLQLSGFSNTSSSTQSTGEFVTSMTQRLSYISVPLLVQYEISDKKFRPYAVGGLSVDYLFASNRSLVEARPGFAPVELSSTSTLPSQNKVNLSAVIGAGMRLRVAGGYFITEVRYKYGFTPVTRSSGTFTNDPQVFSYKYADALYTINCLSLSFGFVQNFFNPKKLKPKK
jgi:hypothetical protein